MMLFSFLIASVSAAPTNTTGIDRIDTNSVKIDPKYNDGRLIQRGGINRRFDDGDLTGKGGNLSGTDPRRLARLPDDLGPYLCVMLTFTSTQTIANPEYHTGFPYHPYFYGYPYYSYARGSWMYQWIHVPILHVSSKNENAIRKEFFDPTGYADWIDEASWGQKKLQSSDVDFITINMGNIDPIDFDLSILVPLVTAQQTYTNKINSRRFSSRPYTRTLIFQPDQPACMSTYPDYCNRAEGGILGLVGPDPTFSRYRGSVSQKWQTIAHELGHNDGLMHSGACSTSPMRERNGYWQYAASSIMGVERGKLYDINAPNRLKLGWMGPQSVVTYDATTKDVSVSALNLGPAGTYRHLLLKIPCSTCTSAQDRSSTYHDGNVYVSFRGDDAKNSKYGVDDTIDWLNRLNTFERGTCTNTNLRLMTNRVHVHYQRTVLTPSESELWTTLGQGESYEIAGPALVIHVCTVNDELGAVVTVGADSATAKALCP